jgi:hypothetical protein
MNQQEKMEKMVSLDAALLEMRNSEAGDWSL